MSEINLDKPLPNLQYAIITREGILEKNNFNNEILPLKEIVRFYNAGQFILENLGNSNEAKKTEIVLDNQNKITFYPLNQDKIIMVLSSKDTNNNDIETFAKQISKQ